MGTAQKWLTLMAGLGAAALVLSNPKGFSSFASGVQRIVGGTTSQIVNSSRKQ